MTKSNPIRSLVHCVRVLDDVFDLLKQTNVVDNNDVLLSKCVLSRDFLLSIIEELPNKIYKSI